MLIMSYGKGLPLCRSSQNQIPRHTQGPSGCALRGTEDLIGKKVKIIFFCYICLGYALLCITKTYNRMRLQFVPSC